VSVGEYRESGEQGISHEPRNTKDVTLLAVARSVVTLRRWWLQS